MDVVYLGKGHDMLNDLDGIRGLQFTVHITLAADHRVLHVDLVPRLRVDKRDASSPG